MCPNGIWQLTEVMKSVLLHEILRLPEGKVSETGTRYPQRNDNETYSYTYYCCLYVPASKMVVAGGCIE